MKFPSLDPLALLLTELETRLIWTLKAFKQILDSYILEISHRGVPASNMYTFKKKRIQSGFMSKLASFNKHLPSE